jgi:hypothetical protein
MLASPEAARPGVDLYAGAVSVDLNPMTTDALVRSAP